MQESSLSDEIEQKHIKSRTSGETTISEAELVLSNFSYFLDQFNNENISFLKSIHKILKDTNLIQDLSLSSLVLKAFQSTNFIQKFISFFIQLPSFSPDIQKEAFNILIILTDPEAIFIPPLYENPIFSFCQECLKCSNTLIIIFSLQYFENILCRQETSNIIKESTITSDIFTNNLLSSPDTKLQTFVVYFINSILTVFQDPCMMEPILMACRSSNDITCGFALQGLCNFLSNLLVPNHEMTSEDILNNNCKVKEIINNIILYHIPEQLLPKIDSSSSEILTTFSLGIIMFTLQQPDVSTEYMEFLWNIPGKGLKFLINAPSNNFLNESDSQDNDRFRFFCGILSSYITKGVQTVINDIISSGIIDVLLNLMKKGNYQIQMSIACLFFSLISLRSVDIINHLASTQFFTILIDLLSTMAPKYIHDSLLAIRIVLEIWPPAKDYFSQTELIDQLQELEDIHQHNISEMVTNILYVFNE